MMELKKAIEILKERCEYYKKVNECGFDKEQEYLALDTVLQALEELEKENGKLTMARKWFIEHTVGQIATPEMLRKILADEYIHKDKIKENIEEQIKRIDKLLEDMIDKSIGCINVSYLSKKEKEDVIAKRNSLTVQKATLQQVLEELLKGE